MADQAALDAYREQIAEDTQTRIVAVLRGEEFDLHRSFIRLDTETAVHDKVVEILRAPEFDVAVRLNSLANFYAPTIVSKIDELSAKLDKVLAILDKPAV